MYAPLFKDVFKTCMGFKNIFTSVQLPTSFIQIRFSCYQNIGEALTQIKINLLYNVLIIGEWATEQRCINIGITCYKISTLAYRISANSFCGNYYFLKVENLEIFI